MAVALDATGTDLSTGTAGTSVSYTGITVGSGTNRGLVFIIDFNFNTVSAPSATWDNGGTNQSMTLLKLQATASGNGAVAVFGLANPTSGNKTLACSWTTSSASTCIAVSFTGVDQTGGVTSFPHAAGANGTGTTNSVTITSATGNAVVAGHTNDTAGNMTSVNNTQLFIDAAMPNIDAGANRASGAATVAMTATCNASGNWASAGTDILAAGAGAAFIAASQKPILQAVKRAAYW